MTAEEALALFEDRAWPMLARVFPANACIEQTRVLCDVLAHFGIECEPLAMKLHLLCHEKEFQYFISGDARDHVSAKRVAAGYTRRPAAEGEGYGYHVVALVERRIVVDLTLAQASCPERGFVLQPQMVVIPLPERLPPDLLPDICMTGVSDNGVKFEARWIGTQDRDWEGTPAWEPSHMLRLIAEIQRRMEGETVGYPYVVCEQHGRQRSYAVCTHCMAGAKVAHFLRATDQDSGEVLCAACNADTPDVLALKLICAAHLEQTMRTVEHSLLNAMFRNCN